MGKVKDFFFNDHIQISLGTGVSIIVLALFFKRYLGIPVPVLESSAPAYVLTIYEAIRKREAVKGTIWAKVWVWQLIMLLVLAMIILRRIWLQP